MEITNELVLLCEGTADRQFFRKLLDTRAGMPLFDIPFPTDKLYGNAAFGGMLTAIVGSGRSFERVRGVLIVADSGNDPLSTFNDIRSQVSGAGWFPVPTKPEEVAVGSIDYPATAIMLLPDSKTPGALETLLIQEIAARRPDAHECAMKFLQCGQIDALSWPAEKRDKAIFGCLIAAVNKDDPSRAASMVFKDPAPVISVTASCFDQTAARLVEFSAAARRA